MTLFNDDTSATSGAHYHEPAASEPEGFTMPKRRITVEHMAEAVRVLSAELGRPVTSVDIRRRFKMNSEPCQYLSNAFRDGLVERSARARTTGDASKWAYLYKAINVGALYRSASRTAEAFCVTRAEVKMWSASGFLDTIKDRRNPGHIQYAQSAWLPQSEVARVLNVHASTVRAYAADGLLERKQYGVSLRYLYRLTPDLVAELRKDKRKRRKRRPSPVPEPTITPQRPSIVQPEPTPEPTPEPSVPTVQTRERVTLRDVLALVLAWIADLMGVNR